MKKEINKHIELFRKVVKESKTYEEIRSRMGYKQSGGFYAFVRKKCNEFGIDYSHIGKRETKLGVTVKQVEKVVKESTSIRNLAIRLGLDYDHDGSIWRNLTKILDENKIDTSHFTGKGWSKGKNRFNDERVKKSSKCLRKQWDEVFKEQSCHYVNNKYLIERLVEEQIKKYACEECGINQWNNKPVRLQLDHINGNSTDNRIENLRILCPNCHSQTGTHSRGQKRFEKKGKFENWYNGMIDMSK